MCMIMPPLCALPKKKALIIGIGYKRLHKFQLKHGVKFPDDELSLAHKNARDLKQFVIDNYHYREDDIVLMLDEEGYNKDLVPFRDNIRREISKLVEGAKEGDHFVLCYAGHGKQAPAKEDKYEEDGLDEMIIGSDGKEILDDDLRKTLADPLPAGSHLVALWDTCHSGTMLDLPHKFPQAKGSRCTKQDSDDPSVERASVISISACRDHQFAWESPEGTSLSDIFMNVLTSNPDSTIRKLYENIHKGVGEMTLKRRQDHPEMRPDRRTNQHILFTSYTPRLDGDVPISKYFG